MSNPIITSNVNVTASTTPINVSAAIQGVRGPAGINATVSDAATSGYVGIVSGSLNEKINNSGAALVTLINNSTPSNVLYNSGFQNITGLKSFNSGISVYYISGGNRGLIDSNNIISVNWTGRKLLNSAGNTIFDWSNGNLNDSTDATSILVNSRVLVGAGGTYPVEWGTRLLRDSSDIITIDWNNKILSGNNWAKDGYYLLTSLDSGNLQNNIENTGTALQNQINNIFIVYKTGDQNIIGYKIFEDKFSQGIDNISSGEYGFSHGDSNLALGYASHAEGYINIASGDYSHAEGSNNIAGGFASHVAGLENIANGDYQTVIGQYNLIDTGALFLIGNGSNINNRNNIFSVYNSGFNINGTGNINVLYENGIRVATLNSLNGFVNSGNLENTVTALQNQITPLNNIKYITGNGLTGGYIPVFNSSLSGLGPSFIFQTGKRVEFNSDLNVNGRITGDAIVSNAGFTTLNGGGGGRFGTANAYMTTLNGGDIRFAGIIQPNSNLGYDVGSTSLVWNKLYVKDINSTGNIYVSGDVIANGVTLGGGGDQNILNPITGLGTENYIPKFTNDLSGLQNSNIIDSGNQIQFGITNPNANYSGIFYINSGGNLLFNVDSQYDIGATSASRPNGINAGGAIRTATDVWVGTARSFIFNGGGRLKAQSDGVMTFLNNSTADFNRLQFGGTTSSFPSIKRSGQNLALRLANDSDFTSLEVKDVYATGNVYTSGLRALNNIYVNSTGELPYPLAFSDSNGDKIYLGKPGTNAFTIGIEGDTVMKFVTNGGYNFQGATTLSGFRILQLADIAAQIKLYNTSSETALDIAVRKTSLTTSSYIYSVGNSLLSNATWGDLAIGAGSNPASKVFIGRTIPLVVETNGNVTCKNLISTGNIIVTGRIGINHGNPISALDVTGNINASGISFNNSLIGNAPFISSNQSWSGSSTYFTGINININDYESADSTYLNYNVNGVDILRADKSGISIPSLNMGSIWVDGNPGSTSLVDFAIFSGGGMASGDLHGYSLQAAGDKILSINSRFDGTSGNFDSHLLINKGLNFSPSGFNSTSITLDTQPFYIYKGNSAATVYLPRIDQTTGRFYLFKNRGNTCVLTGGISTDRFFSTSMVESYTINSGESYIIVNDGELWTIN